MRSKIPAILFGAVLSGFLCSGCIYSHHELVATPSGEVIVTEAPPAPREEVVGIAPDEDDVWIPGHWIYTSQHRWVWLPGHWEARPRRNAIWVPGQWDKSPTGKGWVWTPGHWE